MNISKFNFNDDEIESFKIVQIWIELSKKYFPNYNHTKLKKGDPRKSIIFKNCYKLYREIKGIIPSEEFILYVKAQIEILKIQSRNNSLVLIDSNCLTGDKAWKRWKLWKKKYDSKMKVPLITSANPGYSKAKEGIKKTKIFIQSKFGHNPSLFDYELCKNDIIYWINLGSISPYYIVVSPYMSKILEEKDISSLNFDPLFYKECINKDVIDLFKSLFGYEIK